MRSWVAVGIVVAMLGWGGPVRSDDAGSVSPAGRTAIERVITGQIEAFRRDAGETAFGFASPGIQAMFGDPAHFMAMVRQGYAPLYRPRSFAFEGLVTMEERIVQRVRVVGSDGGTVVALYTMEQEGDGTWRIDGCTLVRDSELRT